MMTVTLEKKKSESSQISCRPDILGFSYDWTIDWLSKTYLMRVLARENQILWINALANRMPTTSSKDISRVFKKLKSFTEPVQEFEPNLFVLNLLVVTTYGDEAVRPLNQIILACEGKGAMKNL